MSRSPRRFSFSLWTVALLLALAFIGFDSFLRIRHVDRVTDTRGVWTDPPSADPQSPTGYASRRRNLVLPYEAVDAYHWIMQTQQMFATGELRVRHVNYDNAPDGREVHWASPFRWWIGALAWIHHQATGVSIPLSVERAALVANPLLLALALLILTPLFARRFGSAAAAAFAIWSIGLGPLFAFFAAAEPDHHGLAILCGSLSVLFVVAGGAGSTQAGLDSTRTARPDALSDWLPSTQQAKRWFIASGVAGGLGLWISAANQVLVLVGIGCAAVVSMALTKDLGVTASAEYVPKLWRTWGVAGALTSLLGYLVEYFPAGSGWRLEVNHPLYAIAWLGAGELLHRFARWRTVGKWAETQGDAATLVAAVLAVLALPVVVIVCHGETFWVADRFLFLLHRNYIEEFRPLSAALARARGPFTVVLLLPLSGFAVGAWLLWRDRGEPTRLSALAFGFVPALILMGFALNQSRWFGVSFGLLLCGIVTAVSIVQRTGSRKLRLGLWVLVVACSLATPIRAVIIWRAGEFRSEYDFYQLALRDLSAWLKQRTGSEPFVVATAPTLSSFFIFHGGAQGVGTFYWENLPGLRTGTALFNAKSADEAYAIVRKHGITHLVMVSWDDFIEEYDELAQKLDPHRAAGEPFAGTLVRTKITPPWLRLLPYAFPPAHVLKEQSVFVFEVVPPQSEEEHLANFVHCLLDLGEVATAARLSSALDRYSHALPALVAKARVQHSQNDRTALGRTVADARRQLEAGQQLAAADALHLATLFVAVGDLDTARVYFESCITVLDEKALRKLPTSALYELLYYAPRVGAQSPPPELVALAFEILPPQMRADLTASVENENR